MKKNTLYPLLLSLLAAIVAGFFTPPDLAFLGVRVIDLYDFVGQLFLNALKMMIVPLVVSSIIVGASRIGKEHSGLALAKRTFIHFIALTFAAALTGFIVGELLIPHLPIHTAETASIQSFNIEKATLFEKVKEVLFRFFPPNIVQAAADGQMVGLILFSLLFGYFSCHIEAELQMRLIDFVKATFQISMKMTQWIIRFLPLAIFALVAKVIALSGMDAIIASSSYFIILLAALALFGFGFLPFVLYYVGGVNPIKHIKAMSPALITAFTTSSSAATLPVTLECLEKEAGVSNRVASFTIPLGTSFLMAGSAIFASVATLFIAAAYGFQLDLAEKGLLLFLAFFLSMGIAGIPSASLVSVIVILNILNLPTEGIALLLVVERFSDMLRTTMNVFANSVSCVLIARKEGEQTGIRV